MADKKTTKAVEAKEVKTIEQLRADLLQKQTDLIAAKRGHAAGELANPKVLNVSRKDIARLHTAIRAAELTSAKESN